MALITLVISIWNAFATQRVVDVIPYLTKPVTDTDDPLLLMMEQVNCDGRMSQVGHGKVRYCPSGLLLPCYTGRWWFSCV